MTSNHAVAINWSSDSQEWRTPVELLKAIQAFWPAGIDLDPCAETSDADYHVPAKVHFRQQDDGLAQVWDARRVFINPPYRSIKLWVKKAIDEFNRFDRSREILLLTPARPGSAWWRMLRDFPVCFIEGRLTFEGAPASAPFPSALFYVTDKTHERLRFAEFFGNPAVGWGDVYERIRFI